MRCGRHRDRRGLLARAHAATDHAELPLRFGSVGGEHWNPRRPRVPDLPSRISIQGATVETPAASCIRRYPPCRDLQGLIDAITWVGVTAAKESASDLGDSGSGGRDERRPLPLGYYSRCRPSNSHDVTQGKS